ncbi:uncharacterized protein N7458_003796 [Penicillium daleae]|uniref:Uncharacterized protein n=1 Tax=Penicillium daleae TaxID=63821 RepID=A0AAD6C9C8_9EURO|nr:uncharacterized protein N7458_003796 [Penicillium daleae]KAJ5455532.1 hypothetical protein N7458_003796 [Penicillium daleae]
MLLAGIHRRQEKHSHLVITGRVRPVQRQGEEGIHEAHPATPIGGEQPVYVPAELLELKAKQRKYNPMSCVTRDTRGASSWLTSSQKLRPKIHVQRDRHQRELWETRRLRRFSANCMIIKYRAITATVSRRAVSRRAWVAGSEVDVGCWLRCMAGIDWWRYSRAICTGGLLSVGSSMMGQARVLNSGKPPLEDEDEDQGISSVTS